MGVSSLHFNYMSYSPPPIASFPACIVTLTEGTNGKIFQKSETDMSAVSRRDANLSVSYLQRHFFILKEKKKSLRLVYLHTELTQ